MPENLRKEIDQLFEDMLKEVLRRENMGNLPEHLGTGEEGRQVAAGSEVGAG